MEREGIVILFAIALFICLVYMIFFFWISNNFFYDSKLSKQSDLDPYLFISILVSVRNEESNIISLLDCLVDQNYNKDLYEIIIINDRSNDNTLAIIKPYLDKYSFIKIVNIHETQIGWGPKKWALNSGIDQSTGDIILQTDADCRPRPNWLKSMAQEFNDYGVSFVFGASPMKSNSKLLSKIFEFDSLAQDSISAACTSSGMIMSCTGRNMGFRKDTFYSIGGYGGIEHFISGDDDLLIQKFACKSNQNIVFNYSNDSIVDSDAPFTINEFINQRLRFASKSINYYSVDTTWSFRLILPLIFITNISVLLSFYNIVTYQSLGWSLVFYFKAISDFILTYLFFKKIDYKWTIGPYLFLSFLHPFYIVFFTITAQIIDYKWKK